MEVRPALALTLYLWCCANICWRYLALPVCFALALHFGARTLSDSRAAYGSDASRISWPAHVALLGVPIAVSQFTVALHRGSLYSVAPMEFFRMLERPHLYWAVLVGTALWCVPLLRSRGPIQRTLLWFVLYLHVILFLRESAPPVPSSLLQSATPPHSVLILISDE